MSCLLVVTFKFGKNDWRWVMQVGHAQVSSVVRPRILCNAFFYCLVLRAAKSSS